MGGANHELNKVLFFRNNSSQIHQETLDHPPHYSQYEAFNEQDWDSLKSITKQIRDYIFNAKLGYKEKIELEFSTMNTKQAFQKVRTLTGQNRKIMSPARNNPITFIENLNTFYTRIYTKDY